MGAQPHNPLKRIGLHHRIHTLPPETRELLAELFGQYRAYARERAEMAWINSNVGSAAYWRTVSTVSRHFCELVSA